MIDQTPTCQICNWTNCGCLNLGEPNGEQFWACHGCIKRAFDKIRDLSEGSVLMLLNDYQVVEQEEDESFLDLLIKARNASKDGDVTISFPLVVKSS